MNKDSMRSEGMMKSFFFLFIFISVAVFFTVIHPVTIISGDDWGNLSFGRPAYPQWHGFNPIKVVPEVSFPLFGNIASSIVMPIGFNFLESIAYLTAILISVLIVVFLHQLYMVFRENVSYSPYVSFVLVSFYYLCMFGMFRKLNNNNSPYMLWEQNLTCYYHYIVPALINGAFSLYLIRKGKSLAFTLLNNQVKTGVLVLIAYLCIFSNIFASIFLAVLCGVVLILNLLNTRFNFKASIKTYPLHAFTLALWAVSAIFEMNGGRADRMAKNHLDISGTINSLTSLLKLTQLSFFIVLVIGVAIGAIYFIRKTNDIQQSKGRYIYWVSAFSGFITLIGLILICAKASPGYATRPAAMWGLFMYLIVASGVGLGYMLTRFRWINYIVPIVVLCLVNKTTDQGHSLRESHNGNVSFAIANAIGQNIINQVVEAVNANERSMTLYVPKGDNKDNWPFPITRGKAISETLKSNGIINRNIEIKINPDRELNKKFGFPVQ